MNTPLHGLSAQRMRFISVICVRCAEGLEGKAHVPVSHDELIRLLATHLRGNTDRMVWCDMQLGPAGSPRPDVWTLNKSYSSPRPIAYEIKVAKSDFQRDVASGKWQEYLRFSCAVTFVVPAGLITKNDLPAGCGLMTWNGEAWHTAKAPRLNPCPPLSQDVMMKLLIDGFQRAADAHRLRQRTEWDAYQAISKKYGAAVAAIVREESNFDERLAQVRKKHAEAERREKDESDARRKRDQANILQAQLDLCAALGIPADSDYWLIRSRVRELVSAVNRDDEVQRLRNLLDGVRESLSRAEKTPTLLAAATHG